MKKQIVALCVLIFCGIAVLAQNDADNKNTPQGMSPLTDESVSKSARQNTDVGNIIGLNFTELVRGTFLLQYNRRIANHFSVQAGGGLQFARDYVQLLSMYAMDGAFFDDRTPSSSQAIGFYEIMTEGSYEGTPHFAWNLGAELNFGKNGMHGGFVKGAFHGSSYGITMDGYDEFSPTRVYDSYDELIEGGRDVKISNFNGELLFGTRRISEGSIKTTHEIYIGIGFRYTSYNSFRARTEEYKKGYYDYTVTVNENTSRRKNFMQPAFQFGYVFGFGL